MAKFRYTGVLLFCEIKKKKTKDQVARHCRSEGSVFGRYNQRGQPHRKLPVEQRRAHVGRDDHHGQRPRLPDRHQQIGIRVANVRKHCRTHQPQRGITITNTILMYN